MKRVAIGLVIVLVLGGIVFASLRANKGQKGPKVYVEEAKRREIVQVVKATGSIDPKEKVNLSSHVVGKIEKLYVREGDSIRAGQPFLELEKDVYVSARDRFAAQLASARTAIRKAEVTLADSRLRLARAVRLAGEGVVSQEQLEAAQLAESSARLSLDEARDAVTQASASLSQAKTDLAKTTIYAPISGRVVRLDAEQGEVVVFGTMNNPASIIGVIADLSEILARARRSKSTRSPPANITATSSKWAARARRGRSSRTSRSSRSRFSSTTRTKRSAPACRCAPRSGRRPMPTPWWCRSSRWSSACRSAPTANRSKGRRATKR
jgi:multidrug efflux pump subunit AcrA (membrane-fusion protein)